MSQGDSKKKKKIYKDCKRVDQKKFETELKSELNLYTNLISLLTRQSS